VVKNDEGVEYGLMTKEKLQEAIVDTLEIQTDMGREIVKVALECVKLFDDKQQDYGSTNISASGEIGIAVRIQDKASRMRHILLKGMRGETGVKNEPLEDTYQDVANYGMIGMLLNRKVWPDGLEMNEGLGMLEDWDVWLEREVLAAKKESRPRPCVRCGQEVVDPLDPDEEYCSYCTYLAEKPD